MRGGNEMAQGSTARAWATGGMVFAATVLLIIGLYQILLGIAAIVRGSFFIVAPNYVYSYSTTSWGWIHLGLGIVAALAGVGLYTGMMWARVLGVIMAFLSAAANFFFLPYYPLWSLLIIALDIFVIWAIAHGGSRTQAREDMSEATAISASPYAGGADQSGERWPATNQPGGRHWAGEPAKEGVGDRTSAEQRQAAEATSRASRAGGGQPPPDMPRNPQGPPQ